MTLFTLFSPTKLTVLPLTLSLMTTSQPQELCTLLGVLEGGGKCEIVQLMSQSTSEAQIKH